MNNQPECPLCEEKPADEQALAEHLIDEHEGCVLHGGAGPLCRSASGRSVRCWCGPWYTIGFRPLPCLEMEVAEGRWTKHLRQRGGAAAHVLEITLGVHKR